MERVVSQRGEVLQGVVAVARPLAGENHTCFPTAARRPPELRLAVGSVAIIDIVASHIVFREPVALATAQCQAETELAGQRTGYTAARIPLAVIRKRNQKASAPLR